MFQYFSFVYQSAAYKTITIHNTYYATNIYNGKGRFLVSGTSHNCLKKRCFFFSLSKKIPATESICAFLLYFFFALSISSVKFSKKVFFIRRPENFSRLFDCSKAGLSICHVKYFPPACASGISCSKPQSPGLKTSQAYDCAGMPASSCLCRRFKNIKEKRIRLVYPVIIPCPASSGGIFSSAESGVVLSWFCKIVKTKPSFFVKCDIPVPTEKPMFLSGICFVCCRNFKIILLYFPLLNARP